jgi:hypothetical protein
MFSLWLIPLYVLGFLLLLMLIFAVLGRVRGGKYLRPIVTALARAPVIGPRIRRLSTAALERQNPDLASAIRKLERAGVHRDPTRAQKAMSTLTAAERRAYLQAAGNPEELELPQNRAMRRQAAKARKSS